MSTALVPVGRVGHHLESLYSIKSHCDKAHGFDWLVHIKEGPQPITASHSESLPFKLLDKVVWVVTILAQREVRMLEPEHLIRATFQHPSRIQVRFANAHFNLDIKSLEMPVDRINWQTVAASPDGTAMTVMDVKGEEIRIESASIRYLVDLDYAAKVDATLKQLQLTREELGKLARESPPPASWYEEPERDLTRASWK